MRFDLIRWGVEQFCNELTQTGTPLRLSDDQPVIGRYYAKQCSATILDGDSSEKMLARFSGEGFAWTLATGRIGFSAPTLMELAPDFRIYQRSVYVYFRPTTIDSSGLRVLMTENDSLLRAAELADVDANAVGARLIQAQLERGFTAIFHEDGHLEFSLGLLELGEKPFLPYQVEQSRLQTYANGRTEIPAGGRDYIGRISLESAQALVLHLKVEGTDSIDVALLPAEEGEASLQNYLTQRSHLLSPKRLAFYAQVAKIAPLKTSIRLEAGQYFLMLDHDKGFGDAQPQPPELAARVDYLIQVGRIED